MTFSHWHGRRPWFVLAAATCVAASTIGALGAAAAVRPASAGSASAGAAAGGSAAVGSARVGSAAVGSARVGSATAGHAGAGPGTGARGAKVVPTAGQRYATLFFSRSEITAADACHANNSGVARMDTVVAPYLRSLRMTATGSLVTQKTRKTSNLCTHGGDSLSASWSQAAALGQTYGWSFVSATATYPHNLNKLSPKQRRAETCGSAATIAAHGLPGAHGMIAYPGLLGVPPSLQAIDGARCFAWGRQFQKSGTTTAVMGITPPYWQYTRVLNGGPCNDPLAPCYTIIARGSPRYQEPATFIALVDALRPGQWLTLQSFILVTGKNPPYHSNGTRWDCTSPNPALHWTNDVERYCYNDWQQIVKAIATRRNITVTDPLTVGVAFGRPAIYP